MNTFPDIVYSSKLIDFFRNEKNITEQHLKSKIEKPVKPQSPLKSQKPKKPESLSFSVFVAPLFFSVVAYVLSKKSFIYAVIAYFAILGFILYEMSQTRKQYKKDLEKFINDSQLYPELLKKFEIETNMYENRVQQYNSEMRRIENVLIHNNDFKNLARLQYISDKNLLGCVVPKTSFENVNKGVAEDKFRKYLDNYFLGEIITNTVIEIFEYNKNFDEYDFSYSNYESLKSNNAYIPDFLFIHKKSKLIIDIEIDEPYHMSTITHYLLNLHDMKRNTYFSERGITTIRFSEEQVKNDSVGCCVEIANLISFLTGDFSYKENLHNQSTVYKHRKWTKQDGLELKNLNFRQRENVKMEDLIK